jgi:hypothetical protein
MVPESAEPLKKMHGMAGHISVNFVKNHSEENPGGYKEMSSVFADQ